MKTNEQSQIEWGKNTIAIYHVVYAHEGFEESAQNLFTLVQEAQRKQPSKSASSFWTLRTTEIVRLDSTLTCVNCKRSC